MTHKRAESVNPSYLYPDLCTKKILFSENAVILSLMVLSLMSVTMIGMKLAILWSFSILSSILSLFFWQSSMMKIVGAPGYFLKY
mgnify:CR=1